MIRWRYTPRASATWKTWVLVGLLLMVGAAAAGNAVTFVVETTEIQAIEEHQEAMWIQLSPSAAARLEEVTAKSHGRELVVVVDGLQIMSARVNVTIRSGVIRADGVSSGERRRLVDMVRKYPYF